MKKGVGEFLIPDSAFLTQPNRGSKRRESAAKLLNPNGAAAHRGALENGYFRKKTYFCLPKIPYLTQYTALWR